MLGTSALSNKIAPELASWDGTLQVQKGLLDRPAMAAVLTQGVNKLRGRRKEENKPGMNG